MRKPPSLRKNNGAIQIRVRVDGVDRRIHRLGSWSDPSAIAKAQALSAQIWSDWCSGCLDPTLERYQPHHQEYESSTLLKTLEARAHATQQGRLIHAVRLLRCYGKPVNGKEDGEAFVRWMEARGLAPSTRLSALSTIRCAHPRPDALKDVRVRVPERSVLEEVLSKREIKMVLDDLRNHEAWYYPIFALWLGTGLRNSELIGLRWDCVRLEERELLIVRSLRRDGTSTHKRVWGSTKTGKCRVVPLTDGLISVLDGHKVAMAAMGLDTKVGLVFVTPRTHRHLYDSGLERVWKRSQRRVGIEPRRLYSQRHSFLSHALAMGNSPADLAAIAGHRTEELLKTYAKPTGRLQLPCW